MVCVPISPVVIEMSISASDVDDADDDEVYVICCSVFRFRITICYLVIFQILNRPRRQLLVYQRE